MEEEGESERAQTLWTVSGRGIGWLGGGGGGFGTGGRGLLRRRSQRVEFSLVQAFPILKVVVQVLHEVGQVGERWGSRASVKSKQSGSGGHLVFRLFML